MQEAEAAVAEAEVRYTDAVAPDSIVLGRPPTAEQRRIALTRSGLQSARVRLERAKLERERAVIESPFEGMVDRVDRTTGERVQAGETLTRVVNLNASAKAISTWQMPSAAYVGEGGELDMHQLFII